MGKTCDRVELLQLDKVPSRDRYGNMSAEAKPGMGDCATGGLIRIDGRHGSDYVRCCAAGGLYQLMSVDMRMMECGIIMASRA